jgi:hypothetical protein
VVIVRSEKSERRRIHTGLVFAETICVSAFIVELLRALGGNGLSWAYVFEWPLLGGYAVYMWRKLLASDAAERGAPLEPVPEEPDDPQLQAWNDYLAQVHASEAAKKTLH